MLNFDNILAGGIGRLICSISVGALMMFSHESINAQTMLNVTNFGARGDATGFFVNTTSNSLVVTTTNSLSNADVGKVIEVFGGGPLGTTNIHQDLLAYITNVVASTNLYLDRAAGATSNGLYAVYGTNNAAAFQACINAAPSNSVINIPDGTYLIIGASNFVSFNATLFLAYPSIVINKGGLTLKGESRTSTILLGCGAWQNKGSYAYRGFMFELLGPVTNNSALIFDNMTLDGGVQQGLTSYHYWPARTTDGDGWDVTHDALVEVGSPPLILNKIFKNLTVRNWRGEQFKGNASWTNGFITVTNCSFSGGDATALNFATSHNYVDCTFSNLDEVEEFYEGYARSPSYFQNCVVTNVVGALMAINGALTNSPNPPYYIQNNTFFNNNNNGIETTPAQNVFIKGNQFLGGGANGGGGSTTAIEIGVAGYQGSAWNSNIVVIANTFSNIFAAIQVMGAGNNSLINLLVSNNIDYYNLGGTPGFAYGYGWGTNMLFVGNKTYGLYYGLNSTIMTGQWYKDDASNLFPPYAVNDNTGQTNVLSYNRGMNFTIRTVKTNSVFVIDDFHPQQIPPGAVMMIKYAGLPPTPLSSASLISLAPVSMTNGYSASFQWTNDVWKVMSPFSVLSPPTGLEASGLKNGQ